MHPLLPVVVGTIAHLGISFVLGFVVAFLAGAAGVVFPYWFDMTLSQLGVALSIWVALSYYRAQQFLTR